VLLPEPALPAAERLLRVADVARLLNVSEGAVRYWIARRWLPALQPGPRSTRIRLADLEALLAQRRRGGDAA